jgi:hypothetical protein
MPMGRLAGPGCSGAHPDDFRIAGLKRQVADGVDALFFEEGRPSLPAVGGLPQTTAAIAGVHDAGIAGNALDVGSPPLFGRADESPFEVREDGRVELSGKRVSRGEERVSEPGRCVELRNLYGLYQRLVYKWQSHRAEPC